MLSSSLTWIDHDSKARERSLRILSLFQEKESRDELGLGAIRDSFADRLFPGTSTIQTRLRYALFIPWIYQALEEEQVPPGEFARRADLAERNLIDAMRNNIDGRQDGIFGGRSGRGLKRLPSSVYWSGLGAWRIRQVDQSQDQYHRNIAQVYRQRAQLRGQHTEQVTLCDDHDLEPMRMGRTWHPRLPKAPIDFPNVADFKLTREEAEFIRDQLQSSHPQSLFAHLALHCQPADVGVPWQHPNYGAFNAGHRELLNHGRKFSDTMHGAALVYNLALAETRQWEEKIIKYRHDLSQWLARVNYAEVKSWSVPRLWELTMGPGHAITEKTRQFVEQWVHLILSQREQLIDKKDAHTLVELRERSLKRTRSRFTNRRALDQWGGGSGLVRMNYRWNTASSFLRDLHEGLNQEGDHA